MLRRGGREDKRIARAVTLKMRCQEASIPEAMRAAEFTSAESRDPAKQMAVRRACMKANPSHRNTPVGVLIVAPAVQTPGTLLLLLPLNSAMNDGEFDHGGGGGGGGGPAAAGSGGGGSDGRRLVAKAAGDDSIDGCMTACDEDSVRQTKTQQPTNDGRSKRGR